ncbi:T9SS type A sorting domain-containing protein, partial [candidate division KSB1 bacterium]|nr:T9SS type A sorting domain-containing protein [candidate division KSB1 bacterium]
VWLSGQPNYHLIDSNYFARRPELGTNGGETIRVGTSDWSMYDSYTIVENNYFEHCNGETEIISNKSCENIYRYNTFYECQGTLTLRHGNRCTVEGNFFFGNKVGDTGGVRIIGEDHVVFNNYFEGLYGSGFRAALPIMNGVPDSPLNRYFQVKNTVIAFNTFVDCRYSFILGAGADDERSLPPLNCVIANNAVKTDHTVIREDDEPIDLTWEGNIMQGSSLGIDQPEGIIWADPNFIRSGDDLWRPAENSPLLGAAVGDYPFIIEDMDGQSRGVSRDVGADQRSDEPIVRMPLAPQDAGPAWLQNPLPLVLSIDKVGSGLITLDPPGQVYEPGTDVTLTAEPAEGWKFVQWDGDISGTENPVTVTIEQDVTVRAVFALDVPAVYALNVYVFSSGGHVELDPPGGSYPESTVVKLSAIPEAGWTFARWEGGLNSTVNPDSVLMDSDKTILGVFEQETSVSSEIEQPLTFALEQNYPNPFNPSTTISFSIEKAAFTQLDIFDNLGKHVKNVLSRHLSPGTFHIEVDARDLTSGVYFYRLRGGDLSAVRKMIVME